MEPLNSAISYLIAEGLLKSDDISSEFHGVEMAKVLLVEDDAELAESLAAWLQANGHLAEHVASAEDGLQMLSAYQFDVIVLDWNLPGKQGIDVCTEYRRSGGTTPIIFLTAQGGLDHKERGLDAGADDYLVKPFEYRELGARIRSVLRRPPKLVSNQLSANGVQLDPLERTISVNGKKVHLRPKEAALLEYFMRHPNKHCGSQELLDAVWPSDTSASVDTIRTWMRNLRQALLSAGKDNFIQTVPGSGYILPTDG